jgi:hypothetical protein
MQEKRRAPRIQPFVVPCRYVLQDRRIPGYLTDLGPAGGRVHTDIEPPAVGANVVLEARLGRQATHVRIPSVVRWSQASPRGGFVFGMSFDGIDPEARRVLETVVEEFHRRAAQIR